MTATGRLLPALAFAFAAALYLLALTASTRFGLGLGLEELGGAAAAIRAGVSYEADFPAQLGAGVLAPGAAGSPKPARRQVAPPVTTLAAYGLRATNVGGAKTVATTSEVKVKASGRSTMLEGKTKPSR